METTWVHYARNLLGMAGAAKKRKELAVDLRAIFAAPARKEAGFEIAARSVAEKWRGKGY